MVPGAWVIVKWTGVDLVCLLFLPSDIRKVQGNLHIPSTWFLVLFNVLLFHSLQFGLLVMFGMELEGYMNTFVSCKIVVC